MPYKKKGKLYYRKGKAYTLKQVQAIHLSKRRASKKRKRRKQRKKKAKRR